VSDLISGMLKFLFLSEHDKNRRIVVIKYKCLFIIAYNGFGLGEGGDFHHKC
jgi:hypothetical protein